MAWNTKSRLNFRFVTPSRVARLGDKLGWQTAKRLREATGHRVPRAIITGRRSSKRAAAPPSSSATRAHAIARPASARPTFSLPAPLSGASVRSSDSPLSPYNVASAARR